MFPVIPVLLAMASPAMLQCGSFNAADVTNEVDETLQGDMAICSPLSMSWNSLPIDCVSSHLSDSVQECFSIFWQVSKKNEKSLIVHSVSQRLNLRHLCEPLGEQKACSKHWVVIRWWNMCDDKQARKPGEITVLLTASPHLSVLWCWWLGNRKGIQKYSNNSTFLSTSTVSWPIVTPEMSQLNKNTIVFLHCSLLLLLSFHHYDNNNGIIHEVFLMQHGFLAGFCLQTAVNHLVKRQV